MNIKEINKSFENCACGKTHVCPIDHIKIGRGVIEEIPEICGDYNKIVVVSDENTYRVCGKDVCRILADKVENSIVLKNNGDGVVIPNEEKIEEIDKAVTEGTDLVIGVGSGVINDLCKYVSFNHDLPYYIVATAPSMDGYASVGCALILEGMKITLNARTPKAIIGDVNVIKDAPMDMIKSGYGDILGKFSCLNDWKLSRVINDEYFCDAVYNMTFDMLTKTKDIGEKLQNRDEDAIRVLTEALVGIGIAMAFVGNSRPGSGSEHHLSHYFEIVGIIRNEPYFLHGIDVVYSAVYTQMLREELLKLSVPPKRSEFKEGEYEEKIKAIYGPVAEGVIALQQKMDWYNDKRRAAYEGKWEEIKKIMEEVPTSERLCEYIKSVGLDIEEFKKEYNEKKIQDAIWFAKDLKDRYTVLWLYFDLMYRG